MAALKPRDIENNAKLDNFSEVCFHGDNPTLDRPEKWTGADFAKSFSRMISQGYQVGLTDGFSISGGSSFVKVPIIYLGYMNNKNSFLPRRFFNVSEANEINIDGDLAEFINFIQFVGRIHVNTASGNAGDLLVQIVAYNPNVYPSLEDTFAVDESEENLLIISECYLAGAKVQRNGLLAGVNFWLERYDIEANSATSRLGWRVACRAVNYGSTALTVNSQTKIGLSVHAGYTFGSTSR